MDNPTRYGQPARLLHWLIASLIVAQYVLAKLAERADASGAVVQQINLLANHKSVGITILLLAIARLLWRALNRPPPYSSSLPRWQAAASKLAHIALYAFLFALPISGWLMSSATAYSVSYFGWITLPDLVGANDDLAGRLVWVHDLLAKALFVTAALHILAAVKHYFIDKDSVMQRMTTVPMLSLFIVVAAGTSVALSQQSSNSDAATAAIDSSTQTDETSTAKVPGISRAGTAGQWSVAYEQSSIRFTAEQAGAEFAGEFSDWEAALWFDLATPESGYFDVFIKPDSVTTGDADRDTTLADPSWFDSSNFAIARFETVSIKPQDVGFVAEANLTIKGQAVPVTFEFNVEQVEGRPRLTGKSRLDRLALGLGLGDWADTATVGQYVQVEVVVETN